LADRIAGMREGRIVQVGTPKDIYHNPVNRYVAGFIGAPAMNFIDGDIVIDDGGPVFASADGRVALAGYRFAAAPQAGPATLGFRPEHVVCAPRPESPAVEVKVSVVEPMGADAVVWADWRGRMIGIRTADDGQIEPGMAIRIALPAERMHLFGPDDTRI
jgi:multiple sugar transport system ATP-binding protein